MTTNYWQKQGIKPLYKELLWDKPENKVQAGKLLIIGGNIQSFSIVGLAYQAVQEAGIGVSKVLLPDSLIKIVGHVLEDCEFAPSNKSGGFSKKSLSNWLDLANWSDGVLLPGDLGRNSETAMILEQFIKRYDGQITITQDALDYFIANPIEMLKRQNMTLVTNFPQLQKLGINSHFNQAFTHNLPITSLIDVMHNFTSLFSVNLILKHNDIYFVASNGQVSTTKTDKTDKNWQILVATNASVWKLQNPNKTFEALTTSLYKQRTSDINGSAHKAEL